jgi:ABC-type branched-subunit amino acid transport system substrate-binding protein
MHSPRFASELRLLVLVTLVCLAGGSGAQEKGPARLLIGMSAPLSGGNASYGNALSQGVRAALLRANREADGPRIELVLLDDAGQPARAVANTRTLLQQKVLALTGYHGAAVLEAVLPVLDGGGTPMVGASSGAEDLRTPARPWLFNLRAGAQEETAAVVYHLDTIGIERIAALAQEDAVGRAGMEGVRLQLVRIGARPTAMAFVPVQASTQDLQLAVQQVCASRPQAVVLALGADNALRAIRQARRQGCGTQFYLLSEAGSELASASVPAAELAGVVVSQVLPAPDRPAHPLVADYLQDIGRGADAAPSYAGLEGYLYGRAVASAARSCGRTPTGECVVQALERGRIQVPGYRLQFSREQRRGSSFVELTMFGSDGKLRR